jgi:molybdenum cofactor biosynthesis enzyme MoaA
VKRRAQWIELSYNYLCNNRCLGCFSASGCGLQMDWREALAALAVGRKLGARNLWLGGGEPTLIPNLLRLVRQARGMGYERVKLQTNGMRLADPAFAKACRDAGVTEVNFAIKGPDARSHDALTRTPGSHDLLMKGISVVRELGLRMEGDVLVYARTVHWIPEIVRFYSGQGLERFTFWLFSASEQVNKGLFRQVPKISDTVPLIQQAIDRMDSDRPDFILSLHTPPCTVPSSHHACLFHVAALDLLVFNPGGYRFWLEESPIEGGLFLERCNECLFRQHCSGLRQDYLRIYGDGEFQPIKS